MNFETVRGRRAHDRVVAVASLLRKLRREGSGRRVKPADMDDETVRKRRNSKSAVQKNRVPAVSDH
jgi:hypothetical protein